MGLQQPAPREACWATRACPAAAPRPPHSVLPVQRWRRQRRQPLAVRAGELPVVDWTRSQVQQCLFIDRCVQGVQHDLVECAGKP